MPKNEDMVKPTLRKRTLKIVASGKGVFELHYMGEYRGHLSKKELMGYLDDSIDIIGGWGEEFAKVKEK